MTQVKVKYLMDLIDRNESIIKQFDPDGIHIVEPGGPVDGYNEFYQEDPNGPYMIYFFKNWRSSFVWENEADEWLVRPWLDVSEHDEEAIIKYKCFEDAVNSLIDFDHTKLSKTAIEEKNSNEAIIEYLDFEPNWMKKENH